MNIYGGACCVVVIVNGNRNDKTIANENSILNESIAPKRQLLEVRINLGVKDKKG